jgi:hypothetical protein
VEFTSQRFTLLPVNLFQKDDQALPVNLHSLRVSLLSHGINEVPLTAPHLISLLSINTMVPSQGTQPQHPCLTIHSADEHHMIHSFSNITSYSSFYAFFSSFRRTLRPMWLANSNLVLSHAQDTQNLQKKKKKTDKTDGKPVLCHRKLSSVLRAVFYTVKLHSLTLTF